MAITTPPAADPRSDSTVDLHDPSVVDAAVIGAKAANLIEAARAGLPVVEGFVVPVGAVAGAADLAAVEPAWRRVSDGGRRPVVVRSSSPVEDTAASSMAGVFESVVDVGGWPRFVDAFAEVMASAGDAPMAVLVQRHLDPVLGGVLFGVDPVSGRTDRRTIATVAGGPWDLVSGAVQGRTTVLTPAGRIVSADGDAEPRLGPRNRQRLLRLARTAAARFGGPQDIEWAIGGGGELWLLQSRPVTTTAEPARGPRLGPGPIAETFPDPLAPLEQDVWIGPLRQAIAETLSLTGAAGCRQLRRSPVVAMVDGRAVADLDLIGGASGRRRLRNLLDPRPQLRLLAAAWRVGRIEAAFDALAADVVDGVDRALESVPELGTLDDTELLRILDNVGRHLVAVHGHELLAARFGADIGSSAASEALAAVARGRAAGLSADEIVRFDPIALTLLTPAIDTDRTLPEVDVAPAGDGAATLSAREALRLRVRWLHELSRRAALELGRRLVATGHLERVADVAGLTRPELDAVIGGQLIDLVPNRARPDSPPLPAVFRLTGSGRVVADASGSSGGVGASPGRARGRVAHDEPGRGDILVVTTLDPSLAPLLARIGGLVAETGSPLSHLAILAREHGVPTVVGHAGARAAFAPGAVVTVDGTTGDVTAELEAPGAGSAA